MQPGAPAQTPGWSVLIILKLLHNAIKHYNYHKLNIQNTHWRICGLGIFSSRWVLEMMGLGDVWRERERERARDGERDDFQGNGESLREGNTREKQSEEEMHLPDSSSSWPAAPRVMS